MGISAEIGGYHHALFDSPLFWISDWSRNMMPKLNGTYDAEYDAEINTHTWRRPDTAHNLLCVNRFILTVLCNIFQLCSFIDFNCVNQFILMLLTNLPLL